MYIMSLKSSNLTNKGICLLNVIMKILTGLIKLRIDDYIEKRNLLSTSTLGFRKHHSAAECIERLIWEIKSDKQKVVVVFLDIERAYDFVVPKKLCNILREYRFPKIIAEWIGRMLNERIDFERARF